jgi:aminoglycoside phosphotransferase (APT) family kinase protein
MKHESKAALVEKITRLYHEDQASGRKAIRLGDIPISYESMTPEWLTAVLCGNHPGAQVTTFRLGPRDSGTSGRRRIYLEYNEIGRKAGLPGSVFAKSSQELVHRLSYKLCGSTHAETNFFNVVRPLLSIETPRSYYAKSDSETCNSIVLLHDLEGYATFCDEHTVISREDALSMARTLAELHAPFTRASAFASIADYFETWPQRWYRLVEVNDMEEYTNRGFRAAEQVIPKRLFARFDEVWPRTMDSVRAHEHLPHTFNHGDTHLGNWYRTVDGHMGLSDWQGCCVGHWARDFIYAIATALEPEQRRAWERDLLAEYLKRSRELGGPMIDLDRAWLWCRQQTLSALAYWTVTYTPSPGMPADMQPKDRSLVFIRRLAHAVDDLEALDSFG